MKPTVLSLCAGVAAAVFLGGCSSQRIESREWYEPTPETVQTRKDGERTGALKSETIKYGQPDWSGNKTFSLFSW